MRVLGLNRTTSAAAADAASYQDATQLSQCKDPSSPKHEATSKNVWQTETKFVGESFDGGKNLTANQESIPKQ